MEGIKQTNRGCSVAELVYHFKENSSRDFTQGTL